MYRCYDSGPVIECLCLQVIYPGSFAGEWEIAATLSNVKFPQGMEFITRDTAGATKASIIAALPDVGAGMDGAIQYRARFLPVNGGAVPDRCASISPSNPQNIYTNVLETFYVLQ